MIERIEGRHDVSPVQTRNFWSGRRDSNARPSHWQGGGFRLGGLDRSAGVLLRPPSFHPRLPNHYEKLRGWMQRRPPALAHHTDLGQGEVGETDHTAKTFVRYRDVSRTNSSHVPGMPLSSWTPLGRNSRPEPTVRSRTVRETITSPAPALPITRAAR